jgi:hypothetical protein
MHGEWYTISPEAAAVINATRGRIVAVGTTCVRTLESAAVGHRQVRPRLRRDAPLHHAWLCIPGGRGAYHQLPHAAHDDARAGERVRRA